MSSEIKVGYPTDDGPSSVRTIHPDALERYQAMGFVETDDETEADEAPPAKRSTARKKPSSGDEPADEAGGK